jgi:hypothetical protein
MARLWKPVGCRAVALTLVVCALSQQRTTAQDRGASAEKMAPIEQYLIADRNSEIALARSAAPKAISGEATILVLTRSGYETTVKGKNGFVCLVDRNWQAPFALPNFWNAKVRAPICYNPQAVRSVVPVIQKRTEWALAGLSKAEIMARVKTAFEKKELGPPEPGAMAFRAAWTWVVMQPSHWRVTPTASAISSRVFASSRAVLVPASLNSR